MPTDSTSTASADPELAAATAEYDSAMQNLRSTLKDVPEYKDALAEKKASTDETADLQQNKGATTAQKFAAAQRGLEATKWLAKVEHAAAARDERVKAAKARLDAALAAHGGAGAPK